MVPCGALCLFLFVCQSPPTPAHAIPDLGVGLPPPLLQDTMDQQQQQAVLAEIIPAEKRELFFRRSLVAPQIVHVQKGEPLTHLGMAGVVRAVDFWCVAYGDFGALTSDPFLNEFGLDRSAQGRLLSAAELQQRGLSLAPNERMANGQYELLKKVHLQGTTRSSWSQSPQSLIVVSFVDDRFLDDHELGNRWQTYQRNAAGELKPSQQSIYGGAGGYVKLTPLIGQGDQLFVEGHFAFFEPHEWFGGANLLGAKLPALIQLEVRRMRKAIAKASPASAAGAGD